MPDLPTDLSKAIGARIRAERQHRRWTLDHLAELSGVSRRLLINVEQGAANPGLGTLLRLSDSLGIGLPALVELPAPAAVKVTRQGEGAALWRSDAGGAGVLVAGTEPPDVLELWDWTLAPGDQHSSEAHSRGTKELVQVQEGMLTVHVGDDAVVLEAGDAVAFPGDVAHSYVNAGAVHARFSLAVFEPGVAPITRTEASHV